MPLDPQSAEMVQRAKAAGAKPYAQMTPEEARASVAGFADHFGPGPELARVDNLLLDVEGGQIPVRVLAPAEPRAVIVHFHGGGWMLGSIDASDTMARTLAQRSGCAVVVVGYRLTPDHPFPTPVQDSWAALQWAASHLAELAGRQVPLMVLGDSSGGNLAAVVARRARDAGLALALQVLVYPVTDGAFDTPSYRDPECILLLTPADMAWFWGYYVAEGPARLDPDVSPLRADDLSGLAPAVVLTAEYDILRDEGEAYAQRLAAAGVPVASRRFAGQMHSFFNMINLLPGAVEGMDYVVAQIDAALA